MAARTNWRLVGLISLGLFAVAGAMLVRDGISETGMHSVVRATARTSLILFLLTFSASALRRLWQSPLSAWLLRNRRYLGVSFAVSHGLHLAALVALFVWWPQPFRAKNSSLALILGGGTAYAFILAMVLTSFDRTAALLGPRLWRLLHTTGSYIVWGIFAQSYFARAVQAPAPISIAVAAAVALALFLRIAAALRKKR